MRHREVALGCNSLWSAPLQKGQSAVDSAWITFYSDEFSNGCCAIAVAALTAYDWMLTLSREGQFFWTGKARPISAILYFSNKYLNLFTVAIATPLWQAPLSDQVCCYGKGNSFLYTEPIANGSCNNVVIMGRVITYLSLIPPAMFSVLRTYALTQNHWLSALVFILSNVQFVTNMVVFHFNVSGSYFPGVGCLEYDTLPPSLNQPFLIATRVSAILADTLLIAITIWKFRHERMGEVKTLKTRGLASVVLYNGILYFIILLILNTLHLVLTEVSIGNEGPTSLVSNFTIPLSSILVSHFILDLQEVSQRTALGLGTNDPLYSSHALSERSVRFASALGSLGATIDPGRDPEEPHEDESPDGSSTVSQFSPSDGCGSSRHTKTDDGFAIMEVPREGEGKVALGSWA